GSTSSQNQVLRKPPSPPAAASKPLESIPPTVPEKISLSRTWNFNTREQANDFKVVKGSWHFVSDGGPDGSGCMETESDGFLAELDTTTDARSIIVTLKYRSALPREAAIYGVGVQWNPIFDVGQFHNVGTRLLFL